MIKPTFETVVGILDHNKTRKLKRVQVMYSYEDWRRAVELYIEYNLSTVDVI